jgi:hypothetical protein
MDDIRLFETDGDFLVLEAQDGQKFRLLIDDTIRSSVKREKMQQLDSVSITPREIQEEIRNGATIDQLIAESGATFEFIEKFAAPVIAELEHIVSSALSVRLTIAGDRYNDSTQIEFGEIITGRLITSGASAISWVAKKIEPNNWHIVANYALNGIAGSATWSFDPRRLTLSPESETAVTLSSQETLNNSVIPKLRTVDLTGVAETSVLDDVIPIGRGAEFETPFAREPQPDQFDVERPEPSTPAAFLKPVSDVQPTSQTSTAQASPVQATTPTPQASPEPLSATADLLEALRRKRTEREVEKPSATALDSHPDTSSLRVIDITPAPTQTEYTSEPPVEAGIDVGTESTGSTIVDADENSSEPKTSAPKKGRATMPSWDEIVFGTKADD